MLSRLRKYYIGYTCATVSKHVNPKVKIVIESPFKMKKVNY